MNEIDWSEYEHRKKRVGEIGLTCEEYEMAIKRIVLDLEWEADNLPIRKCPNCEATKFSFAGAYRCQDCHGVFEHSDLNQTETVAA